MPHPRNPLPVTALYVDNDKGPYVALGIKTVGLPDDARFWRGDGPVVTHPPCAPWGRFRWRSVEHSKDGTKDCAPVAVAQVREHGGVLEHPAGSLLWKEMGLPRPGEPKDKYGGYTIQVNQVDWGHPCEKKTWLYIVGVDKSALNFPPKREPTHCIEPHSGSGTPDLPRLPKSQRHLTPPAFAYWLVTLAQHCIPPKRRLVVEK